MIKFDFGTKPFNKITAGVKEENVPPPPVVGSMSGAIDCPPPPPQKPADTGRKPKKIVEVDDSDIPMIPEEEAMMFKEKRKPINITSDDYIIFMDGSTVKFIPKRWRHRICAKYLV